MKGGRTKVSHVHILKKYTIEKLTKVIVQPYDRIIDKPANKNFYSQNTVIQLVSKGPPQTIPRVGVITPLHPPINY